MYEDKYDNLALTKSKRKFPRSLRLKKRREFEIVYRNGKKYWNKIFVVNILPNKVNITRLGLTVSKKVGKSVKRSRVKRLIRESFRLSQEQILPGYDIVVVAQSRAYGLKCQQARLELLSLLRRAGILEKEESTFEV